MIITDPTHLLFIEPTAAPTAPVVDDITRKITAAWRARWTDPRSASRGWHDCTGAGCKAMSDNLDHTVHGLLTNSLCVHYVACHRAEVPPEELARIAAWSDEAEPTESELIGRLEPAKPVATMYPGGAQVYR